MIPNKQSSNEHHALVIGGTGMLSAVSLALTRTHEVVTVVARNRKRLHDLQDNAEGRLHPLALDYTDYSALSTGLAEAKRKHGAPVLAVVWMHDHALGGLPTVLESLAGTKSRLFLVRGSASAAPDNCEHSSETFLKSKHPSLIREVVLGWVPQGASTRWMTHDEISKGVLNAIATDKPFHLVGTVAPWATRP